MPVRQIEARVIERCSCLLFGKSHIMKLAPCTCALCEFIDTGEQTSVLAVGNVRQQCFSPHRARYVVMPERTAHMCTVWTAEGPPRPLSARFDTL